MENLGESMYLCLNLEFKMFKSSVIIFPLTPPILDGKKEFKDYLKLWKSLQVHENIMGQYLSPYTCSVVGCIVSLMFFYQDNFDIW